MFIFYIHLYYQLAFVLTFFLNTLTNFLLHIYYQKDLVSTLLKMLSKSRVDESEVCTIIHSQS